MRTNSSGSCVIREESDLGRLYDLLEAELPHGEIDVVWIPYKPQRSTLQNRLYWEYMTQLGDYTGHTKDEMSLFFKWKFLGADKTEVYGQTFNAVKSTTDLNVKEFNEYLRNIEVFASEQGFTFKLPSYYGDIWGRE